MWLVVLHGSGALLSVASIVLFLAGVGGPILVPLAGSVLYNMSTLTAVMMVSHHHAWPAAPLYLPALGGGGRVDNRFTCRQATLEVRP